MSDDPTEHVQEEIHHHASAGSASKWITAAATTAAILAALAAGASALATSHLTQSTLIRIEANDNWNYYQAKSIKSSLLDAKIYSAQLSKVDPRKSDVDKKEAYAQDMAKIQTATRDLEKLSRAHLDTHETYEIAATLFHIAIAVVAISVVARRKEFWFVSMAGGAIGLFFFAKALLHAPPHYEGKSEPPAQSTPANPSEPESAAIKK